jgi:hypothetical protein
MKKARITIEVLYNEQNYCAPSGWDFEQILDLEPSEKVDIIEIKELEND